MLLVVQFMSDQLSSDLTFGWLLLKYRVDVSIRVGNVSINHQYHNTTM